MPRPDLRFDGGNLRAAAGYSYSHLLALLGDFLESAPIAVERGLPARQPLPALDHYVHVLRIEFDTPADPLG
jgi:hypothetical protein